MMSLDIFNAIDRLFMDIVRNNISLGGKSFLFGGDFRKTLPIIRRGNRTLIIENCILRSPIWPSFVSYYLTGNQRAIIDPQFAHWLLCLGNGTLPYEF